MYMPYSIPLDQPASPFDDKLSDFCTQEHNQRKAIANSVGAPEPLYPHCKAWQSCQHFSQYLFEI